MRSNTVHLDVVGPWSLRTSRIFWEGFTPAALDVEPAPIDPSEECIHTVFRVDSDWSRADARITQVGASATVDVSGEGDLDAAVRQVSRFLSLDVDARGWPEIGIRDPVIGDAQARLPGLRPCGFHSPYEAASWAVLTQRIQIRQAARMRRQLVDEHGDDGAFPAPERLRRLDLDLPGRKSEYLRAVADAALDGLLDGETLRCADPATALSGIQQIKGMGPFAAELVLLRGANAVDSIPLHERRLFTEVAERYGEHTTLAEVSEAWRPFRTWASVHLRALREYRTHEIAGGSRSERGRDGA